MMSLPGAIATIKTSLLRSLFMAKMALIMIIYNAIKGYMMKETVVVHKVATQNHEHFYSPEFSTFEKEISTISTPSWWGR